MIEKELKKQEMYAFITACLSSGEKPYSYCKRHEMNYGAYRYWLAKYKLDQSIATSKKEDSLSKASNFISLEVISESSISSPIEIQYPNGVSLRLNSAIATNELRNLINILSCLD
ncbi:hypothetical protein U8527_08895 [Kordia algicida OT-1]|uniref:Transposase n=1 Tax=Kordia algicida OT-1 TaxID=391587 RepID=A9EDY5_9FLAO|nr:hypothetical protein [Kordia algicida]EDP94196.1 hypothetical protein KAOT1_02336 [Kordia algicida OT-1]